MNKTSPSTIEYRTNDKTKRGDERHEQITLTNFPPQHDKRNDERKERRREPKWNTAPTKED